MLQALVDRLLWASPQKHRQPYLSPLELAFVEEPCPRKRCRHKRRRLFLFLRKDFGSTWLVMVLQETKQLVLIPQFCAKMKSDTLGVLTFQAVIEPLVVAEIETLLLEFPLQVPVAFSHEAEVGMSFLLFFTAGITSRQ